MQILYYVLKKIIFPFYNLTFLPTFHIRIYYKCIIDSKTFTYDMMNLANGDIH